MLQSKEAIQHRPQVNMVDSNQEVCLDHSDFLCPLEMMHTLSFPVSGSRLSHLEAIPDSSGKRHVKLADQSM